MIEQLVRLVAWTAAPGASITYFGWSAVTAK